MYTGRDEDREEQPLAEHVVLTLVEKLRGSGLNVTVDNFFLLASTRASFDVNEYDAAGDNASKST